MKFYFLKLCQLFFSLFFSKKHLSGLYFEKQLVGWKWCLSGLWFQKFLGFNRSSPIPIHPQCKVSTFDNIFFPDGEIHNFQSPGTYYQCFAGRIFLGKGVFIAPNVGMITANHDLSDLTIHLAGKDILIGNGVWVGMNSVILPGVTIADGIIVGAGSVVTKSFHEKNIIIAGNPAKKIREI